MIKGKMCINVCTHRAFVTKKLLNILGLMGFLLMVSVSLTSVLIMKVTKPLHHLSVGLSSNQKAEAS
jgi:hypothetical protein